MAEESPDRTLPRERLEEMVRAVRPEWRLHRATIADSGWTAVYHLVVDTDEGRRQCVLKATPFEDRAAGIDAEARIQAVVREHTDIPAPAVLGAVDDHERLRTPFFLMESLPGATVPMADVGSLSDATLRRVARETGRYLGQLHGVDVAFDAFGKGVDHDGSTTLRGEPPPGDPSELVVADGAATWREQLREWFEDDLEGHAESPFADLTPVLRRTLYDRFDALPDEFVPVLGRADHGWFNLLVDREAGTLEGVVDWGSRFAVPPAFDLSIVEYLLAGGWWTSLPEVPDRRPLVREALLAGYRAERSVPDSLAVQRACYQLDELVRWMALHQDREGATTGRTIPPERHEEAAAGLRAAAEAELEREVV